MNFSDNPELERLMTPQLFKFVRQAQIRYATDDLVVILDLTDVEPEFVAVRRSEMASSDQIPPVLRAKLSKPAAAVAEKLSSPDKSFWFFAIHDLGRADCVAVNASIIGPGGNA